MYFLRFKLHASDLLFLVILSIFSHGVYAQVSQSSSTKIQGNIEINAQSDNMTAVATGTNSVAKNRVGVVDGPHKGNTKINVDVRNVTTVSGGNNRKACTTIGGVTKDECK